MTTEDRVRFVIGELYLQKCALESRVEQLEKEKAELQKKIDEKGD